MAGVRQIFFGEHGATLVEHSVVSQPLDINIERRLTNIDRGLCIRRGLDLATSVSVEYGIVTSCGQQAISCEYFIIFRELIELHSPYILRIEVIGV